jgi:DNA modification methylase
MKGVNNIIKVNNIYSGNCVDIMQQIPNEYIDLTVTSPPYDNLRTYKGYKFEFEKIAQELFRVTKIGGVVVWVVGDATVNGSETGTSFRHALYFKEIGFNLHDTMIYQKECIFPDTNRYLNSFEYMFVFSKGKPKTVNLLMDRPNKSKSKKTGSTYRQPDGSVKHKIPKEIKPFGRRNNIWYYSTGFQKSSKDKIAYQHPAIFPEQLANDHIISWSNPGDLVLDPMCGSGTTCKMAKLNDRNFIGIDISEEYCEIARERVKLAS